MLTVDTTVANCIATGLDCASLDPSLMVSRLALVVADGMPKITEVSLNRDRFLGIATAKSKQRIQW